MKLEPENPITFPVTVMRIVPPGLSVRTRHDVSLADTVQPPL
jgi:hypothetical protein